jgi:hypothetical protein
VSARIVITWRASRFARIGWRRLDRFPRSMPRKLNAHKGIPTTTSTRSIVRPGTQGGGVARVLGDRIEENVPCDSISLNRVDIDKLDPGLHRATDADMEAAGWSVAYRTGQTTAYQDPQGYRFILVNGQSITSERSPERIAELRNTLARAYSKQAIYARAQKHGWKVRQTGVNSYEVQR